MRQEGCEGLCVEPQLDAYARKREGKPTQTLMLFSLFYLTKEMRQAVTDLERVQALSAADAKEDARSHYDDGRSSHQFSAGVEFHFLFCPIGDAAGRGPQSGASGGAAGCRSKGGRSRAQPLWRIPVAAAGRKHCDRQPA